MCQTKQLVYSTLWDVPRLAKGLHFLLSNTFAALPVHDPAQLHVSEEQPELLVMVTTLTHDKRAAVGSAGDLHVPVMLEDGGQWGDWQSTWLKAALCVTCTWVEALPGSTRSALTSRVYGVSWGCCFWHLSLGYQFPLYSMFNFKLSRPIQCQQLMAHFV